MEAKYLSERYVSGVTMRSVLFFILLLLCSSFSFADSSADYLSFNFQIGQGSSEIVNISGIQDGHSFSVGGQLPFDLYNFQICTPGDCSFTRANVGSVGYTVATLDGVTSILYANYSIELLGSADLPADANSYPLSIPVDFEAQVALYDDSDTVLLLNSSASGSAVATFSYTTCCFLQDQQYAVDLSATGSGSVPEPSSIWLVVPGVLLFRHRYSLIG